MFRNSEGYADPTAGAALKHITYEESRKKRRNQARVNSTTPRNKGVRKNPRKSQRLSSARKRQHSQKKITRWVQVWPKDKAGMVYIEREMEKRK